MANVHRTFAVIKVGFRISRYIPFRRLNAPRERIPDVMLVFPLILHAITCRCLRVGSVRNPFC